MNKKNLMKENRKMKKKILPMRIIYNDKRLGILKKRNCKFKEKD